jgi:DNA-binding XRE family transcriptional regulator
MLRGVRIDGGVVSGLRRSRALSQRDLAKSAGVSERTIRNAEKGQAVESHIALYIATALEVPLADIVVAHAVPSRSDRLHATVRSIGKAYLRAVLDGEYYTLAEQLHPRVEWNFHSSVAGGSDDFVRGQDNVIEHLRELAEWWGQFELKVSDFSFRRIDVEGDMLYFFLVANSDFSASKDSCEIWQTFVCRREEGLLISVDQYIGVCLSPQGIRNDSSGKALKD